MHFGSPWFAVKTCSDLLTTYGLIYMKTSVLTSSSDCDEKPDHHRNQRQSSAVMTASNRIVGESIQEIKREIKRERKKRNRASAQRYRDDLKKTESDLTSENQRLEHYCKNPHELETVETRAYLEKLLEPLNKVVFEEKYNQFYQKLTDLCQVYARDRSRENYNRTTAQRSRTNQLYRICCLIENNQKLREQVSLLSRAPSYANDVKHGMTTLESAVALHTGDMTPICDSMQEILVENIITPLLKNDQSNNPDVQACISASAESPSIIFPSIVAGLFKKPRLSAETVPSVTFSDEKISHNRHRG